MKTIKYIELFCGIGAFTQAVKAISNYHFTCVYSCDINVQCSKDYEHNYGINPLSDITKVDPKEIPEHDFCFFSPPCQAFSKSGFQRGFEDTRGTLIYDVFRILKEHHPKYILMENVRNIVSHDHKHTINVIKEKLKELGYRIPDDPIILSPHQFGIPQTRDRAFIPGIYDPENTDKSLKIEFKNLFKKSDCSVDTIIDHRYDNCESLKLSKCQTKALDVWEEFYKIIDTKVIGFPIWEEYFFEKSITDDMPDWKKDFIVKNKQLYLRNKSKIDKWLKKYNYLKDFIPTYRKFEWQAGTKISSIWDGIIQFRPSGIRVKEPTTFPALVAIVQIPYIGKLKRKLSVQECLSLQSFEKAFSFTCDDFTAYKELGNSINVTVLKEVVLKLLSIDE